MEGSAPWWQWGEQDAAPPPAFPGPSTSLPNQPLTTCPTWFEHVSMLVIMLNCVTLGMFRPCEDVKCRSERCSILEVGPGRAGAGRARCCE